MKKTTTIILLALLAMTFQAATVQKDEEMNRKLRGAIIMGRTDEVKELIKAGVDVNRKFDIGENRDITPLFCVCAIGSANQAEIGKLLIDAGAKVNEKFQGATLLHITATFAGNKALTELLIANGLDVNAKIISSSETQGSTPLHLAAGTGKAEVAEVLIRNGAEVNIKNSYHHYTPLHLAALNGKKAVAELLINKGADVNAKSETGVTPLDLATEKGKKELVDLLRKHGGVSGKSGTTMLFSAAREFPFWSR
jgi:ankyrin repeat protein